MPPSLGYCVGLYENCVKCYHTKTKILLNSCIADFYTKEANFRPLPPQLNLYLPFRNCFVKRNFLFCFDDTAPLFGRMGEGREASSLHNYCSSWGFWVTCHFWSAASTHFWFRTFLSRMNKLSAREVISWFVCVKVCVWESFWGKLTGILNYAKAQESIS